MPDLLLLGFVGALSPAAAAQLHVKRQHHAHSAQRLPSGVILFSTFFQSVILYF
jgi:hypothetical protein